MSLSEESAVAAVAKSVLPVGVTGGLYFGYSISELVQIITLLYLLLQVGLLMPKYWRLYRAWRERK